jgi:hypothetical protein
MKPILDSLRNDERWRNACYRKSKRLSEVLKECHELNSTLCELQRILFNEDHLVLLRSKEEIIEQAKKLAREKNNDQSTSKN